MSDFEDIAIIGMSLRVPGAKNVKEFWDNLRDGRESISFFSNQELKALGVDPALLNDPHYVKAGFILEDIELFDASFFGYTPREAEIIDPQQRLFLECAWEALENAGYDSEVCRERIGVYGGAGGHKYWIGNILSAWLNGDLSKSVSSFQLLVALKEDFLATRVSYKLNLKGPSFTVSTACSTSLVAVHLACTHLLDYQCDMALVGAASILQIPQRIGYLYEDGISSPDGHCRAFDAKARGVVFGSGVGVVVLKRLSEAIADGDHIHALIKGSAMNNDGASKIGFIAPSVDGQAEVIAEALDMAGVDPEMITYVEAHGTGTPLGDPIEIAALTQAFRAKTEKSGFCAIGSAKTNVGHLNSAAGIAGLIKTILALQHKMIPPSLYFEQPNPKIDFANSPFYVNARLSQWQTDGAPRRAGVSSFGVGGTNVHVVLEEAPAIEPSGESRPWQLIVLSAKTDLALETMTTNLVEHLRQHPHLNLADVAYTLQVGRRAFNHRRMVVCQDLEDVMTCLETRDPKRVVTAYQKPRYQDIVFMFPGGGAQYVNMGLELCKAEPTFRKQIRHCAELLKPHLGLDLQKLIYPSQQTEKVFRQMERPFVALPALFAVEYALAKLWMSWGVYPQAMIGHSLGEYVAACLAGVFSLEDALALVAERGRLVEELPSGAMLSVPLPERDVLPLLGEELDVAVINGPSLCVVSGPAGAIDKIAQLLSGRGVESRRLRISGAGHSRLVTPILERFTHCVEKLHLQAPSIPYLSNVTGTWITAAEATDPTYWARHLRQTVRFSEGMQGILTEPSRILLEVGPGRVLSSLTKSHLDDVAERTVLSSIRHPQYEQPDEAFLLTTLGKLWLAGIQVDWAGFYAKERRHRLLLPTYPFERQRHWIEVQTQTHDSDSRRVTPAQKADIAEEPSLEDDKKGQLSARAHPRPGGQTHYVAPRSELEQTITNIWQRTLGFQSLGVHDDFLDLGGNSLLAFQIMRQIRETFQVELSIDALFQAPSVAGLAERIEKIRMDQRISQSSHPPLILPVPRDKKLPLSFVQKRLWHLDQSEPDYNRSRYYRGNAFHITSKLNVTALEQSLNQIVRRHETLRTTFTLADGQPVQVVAPALSLALPVVDLEMLPKTVREIEARRLVALEWRRPFNLAKGPLLRVVLLRLQKEEYVFLLRTHSIVCDGRSQHILIQELRALYEAFSTGTPLSLPELPIQYADFASWQRQWMQGEVLNNLLSFWRQRLAGAPTLLALPTDSPQPDKPTHRGAYQPVGPLPEALTKALEAVGRGEKATLFMTLQAAFTILLCGYTGQKDILLGVISSSSERVGLDGVVGNFTNLVPLRTDLSGNPSFRELLGRVREATLEVYAHQDLHFELIKEAFLNQGAGHTPLLQVAFSFLETQHKTSAHSKPPTLTLEIMDSIEDDNIEVDYDLTLALYKKSGQLAGFLQYNIDLFDVSTINGMIKHFRTLLENIVADQEQQLSDLLPLAKIKQ